MIRVGSQGTKSPPQSIDSKSSININNLPFDLLEIVFSKIDCISRKRAERVCKYWCAFLRTSPSLKQSIKVDLSTLALLTKTDLHLVVPQLITAETKYLHIFASDSRDDGVLWVLVQTIPMRSFQQLPKCQVLLDELAVPFFCLSFFISTLQHGRLKVNSLKLRNVRLVGIHISSRFQEGLVESVTCKIDPSIALKPQLLLWMNQLNGPLSLDEVLALKTAAQQLRKYRRNLVNDLIQRFGELANLPMDWDGIEEGRNFSPFTHRLLTFIVNQRLEQLKRGWTIRKLRFNDLLEKNA